jgi:CysZ protein
MLRDFFQGSRYFILGFRTVVKPGLRKFLLIPLFVNTLIFSAGIFLGIQQFNNLLEWLLPGNESWWIEYAKVFLWIIFSICVLLISFYTFSLIANLIAAPFNGLLSEKVEKLLTGGEISQTGGVFGIIKGIPASVMSELRKFLYFAGLGGMLFIFSLMPGVNVIAPFLWLVYSSWALSLEYISYPMENHNILFSYARKKIKPVRLLALGFGSAIIVANLIPFINFFVMPAAVAGATIIWKERLREKSDIST